MESEWLEKHSWRWLVDLQLQLATICHYVNHEEESTPFYAPVSII